MLLSAILAIASGALYLRLSDNDAPWIWLQNVSWLAPASLGGAIGGVVSLVHHGFHVPPPAMVVVAMGLFWASALLMLLLAHSRRRAVEVIRAAAAAGLLVAPPAVIAALVLWAITSASSPSTGAP